MTDETYDVVTSGCSAVPAPGPEAAAAERERADARRFRVVAIVAAALLAPQALVHLLFPIFVVPTFSELFASMGGVMPAPTAFIVAMGPWLGLVLVAIDVLVFWGFYRLARTYWIGLLFAPLLALGVLLIPVVVSLYLPMFEVITLVE